MAEPSGEQTENKRALPVSQEASEYAKQRILISDRHFALYKTQLLLSRPTLMHVLDYLHIWRISQLVEHDAPVVPPDSIVDTYLPSALVFYGAAVRQAQLNGQRLPKTQTNDIGRLISHQFEQADKGNYYNKFKDDLPKSSQPYPELGDHLNKADFERLLSGGLAYIDDVNRQVPFATSQRFFDTSRRVLDHALQRFVQTEAIFVQSVMHESDASRSETNTDKRLVGAMDAASLIEVAYLRCETDEA